MPVKSAVPQKSSSLFNFLIQFVVVGIVFFAIGFAVGNKRLEITKRGFVPQITVSNKLSPTEQNIDFSLFWDVWQTLPEKFLDKAAINGQKLLYGAISGMVRSLGDPYTAFLDPKQNEAVKSELSGSYEGVGIQIGFDRDKRLVVIAPLRRTPAERAGILARDLILKIDDRETFDLTLPEAVNLIRGPANTKVKLVLQHQGEDKTYEVEIERAKIDVKSIEFNFVQKDGKEIAVVTVGRFNEKTNNEWDEAVGQIVSRKIAGVVVDMRNNPGGLLSSSVYLASEFVKGTIVKQQFANGQITPIGPDHQGKLLKIPLVVLVNGGSASASEIFAGAIGDNKRGKVIGEKTFGKGTVQDVVDLKGGSGLHITVAKWLTPKGDSINGLGITPDVIIESPVGQDLGRDPQLEKALELLL